ncbi:MAG: hypothetical protein IT379_30805 [Deltaproteobacteria bacterium]|nr:hypothetical protein [Deltaproteobacteria bacterium]
MRSIPTRVGSSSSPSSFAPVIALACLAALACAATASSVRAQQPAGDPTVRARELYQEGRRLGEQGRWEEARTTFERALALREAPLLHFALGTAQAETRRFVAARASLRRFLATASDDAARAQVPAAEAALRALEPRIAHLVVNVTGGRPREVRLDGTPIDLATLGQPLDVDPGQRTVEVIARAGATPIAREVRLAEGAREEVTIELAALLPRSDRGTTGTRRDDDGTGGGGVLTQWWFWTAVGVVVVGATVGVVAATQSGARDPFVGDAPAIQTLRLPE